MYRMPNKIIILILNVCRTHLFSGSMISAAWQRYHRMPRHASCDSCHVPSPSICPMALVWTAIRKRCPAIDRARIWQTAADRYCGPTTVRVPDAIYSMCPNFDWRIYPCCSAASPAVWLPSDRPLVWANHRGGRLSSPLAILRQNGNGHDLALHGMANRAENWLAHGAMRPNDCCYPLAGSSKSVAILAWCRHHSYGHRSGCPAEWACWLWTRRRDGYFYRPAGANDDHLQNDGD